jgi:ATP-dependent helicase HrpA
VPYQDALKKLQTEPARSPDAQRQREAFRWMIEEFKVSLFAQELGTAMPVSPKRLDQQLELVRYTRASAKVLSGAGGMRLPRERQLGEVSVPAQESQPEGSR